VLTVVYPQWRVWIKFCAVFERITGAKRLPVIASDAGGVIHAIIAVASGILRVIATRYRWFEWVLVVTAIVQASDYIVAANWKAIVIQLHITEERLSINIT